VSDPHIYIPVAPSLPPPLPTCRILNKVSVENTRLASSSRPRPQSVRKVAAPTRTGEKK